MYLLPNQAMELLQITTRQGLHKVVVNHNITVKSQGQGKPNLYLKEDLERYKKDNAKNIEKNKTKTVIQKAKQKKEKVEKKKEEIEEIKKVGFINDDPLNEIGKEVFSELREQLISQGTYKEKDFAILQAYCINYQKYINAVNQSAENMDTFMDDFGNVKVHPYFQIADKCLNQMIKLANILGIGARSRVGLEIQQPKKESIFDIITTKTGFED